MNDDSTNVGVLKELDGRVPTRFYWQLTLLATLGGFLFGYDTANVGSARPVLPYKLGDFASGYLVAGAPLGAAGGAAPDEEARDGAPAPPHGAPQRC